MDALGYRKHAADSTIKPTKKFGLNRKSSLPDISGVNEHTLSLLMVDDKDESIEN